MTRVDPRLHPLAAFDITFPGGESLQLGFQSQQYGLRKAVRQMESHMLRHLGTFKVRQISAAMPSGRVILLPGNAILRNGVFRPANREIGVPGIGLRVVH